MSGIVINPAEFVNFGLQFTVLEKRLCETASLFDPFFLGMKNRPFITDGECMNPAISRILDFPKP
jgi:hypothetical protein